ncbi:MAG: LacI family DNA-binding transcriptional regulator [Lachnospiraceae bacterium]|nr:LacI family DNA-binding transcriptional regulator [Lachnospiraceae bacterium]
MDIIEKDQSKENITIHDVARALGVSASTVSRAISGKGRIGEETRQRVLQYIDENSFYPNASARSLAKSKTYNIAIIMPEVKDLVDMPFFHTCMHGAEEVAQVNDYDLLIVTTDGTNIKPLERMVNNQKVDGMILTRLYRNDVFVDYLKTTGMPFVAIGNSDDPELVTVDHDNYGGCRELVGLLFSKGIKKVAYLGGGMEQTVNIKRYEGYCNGLKDAGKMIDNSIVYTDLTSKLQVSKAAGEILKTGTDCILCQDDYICDEVVHYLAEKGVEIPKQMKVASCHHSKLLDNYPVTITSLKFDTMDIGRKACQVLLSMINGEEAEKRTLLGYEVNLKESTQRTR